MPRRLTDAAWDGNTNFVDDQGDIEEHEITDIAELGEYAPIIGCAVVPAFVLALLFQWLLRSIDAPAWTDFAVGIAYATIPYSAVVRWTRNKKAIRFSDGEVLRTAAARRFVSTLWLTTVVILIWRYLTW